MKKLFYLFTILFLFSCSSDEDILFLEKYNGVVWQEIDNDSDYAFGHIFYNSPQSGHTFELYNGIFDCYLNTFGVRDNWGTLLTVKSQSENILTLDVNETIDGVAETYTIKITASSNGNNMTIEYSNEPDGTEYYERINNNPCL